MIALVTDLFMQEEAKSLHPIASSASIIPRKKLCLHSFLVFLVLFISICLLIRSDTLRFNMKCNMQESLPEHSQIHLLSLSGPIGIFRLLSRAQQQSHLHIVALTDSFYLSVV